jgi:hypothetical protein
MSEQLSCAHGKLWSNDCAECSSEPRCQSMRMLIWNCSTMSKAVLTDPVMSEKSAARCQAAARW